MVRRHRGGELFEGDSGCVVHPGLTEHIDKNQTVTKVFKSLDDKVDESKALGILNGFPNDFIVKPIPDSISIPPESDIRNCKLKNGPLTEDYIKKNSISYQYLGPSLDKVAVTEAYLKPLLELLKKVIDMNSKGYSHGDIAARNISFMNGKAYLIDVGAFEYRPGTTNYTDTSDLLKVIVRVPGFEKADEDDKIILNSFAASIPNNKNIGQLVATIGGKRLKKRKTRRRRKQWRYTIRAQ